MKNMFYIIVNIIVAILLAIGILIAISLLPINNNYKLYTVRTGSMEPTIPIGSVIAVKSQPDYQSGDIITFLSQQAKNKDESTTHRIISKEGVVGNYEYTTKGDANDSADAEKIPQYKIIGKSLFHIPLIGYLLVYLKTLPGLILIIIIPATIIIYEESKKIHSEAKNIIKKRKDRKNLPSNIENKSEGIKSEIKVAVNDSSGKEEEG